MKRLILCLAVVGVLLFGSLVAEAATVSVDYLFGDLEGLCGARPKASFVDYDDDEVDVGGFLLKVEHPINESWGLRGDVALLKVRDLYYWEDDDEAYVGMAVMGDGYYGSGDLKVKDWSIYGTYVLPWEPVWGLSFKALGGYGKARFTPEWDDEEDSLIFKGFKAGAAAEWEVADGFTLGGEYVRGLGTKVGCEHEMDGKAKLTAFRLTGGYAVAPDWVLQAGYTKTKYEVEDSWRPAAVVKGLFMGAKVTF